MCGIFACIGCKLDVKSYSNEFNKIKHRGPDASKIVKYSLKDCDVIMGFHRLAIMDTSDKGMQPFEYHSKTLDLVCICNGEIYNFKELEQELIDAKHIKIGSHSDCEVIAPLFEYLNRDIEKLCNKLDGEFSFIILDKTSQKLYVGSDLIRCRPLFIGTDKNNSIYLSSEMKAISELVDKIKPFPPASYWVSDFGFNKFKEYYQYEKEEYLNVSYETAKNTIRDLLIKSVKMKLQSDREYAFLLSGGIDSSLVCSIAAKLLAPKRIRTFTMGFTAESPDILASREVAKHINSIHEEIIVDMTEGVKELDQIIYHNESYDETTCRASTPMKLAVKHIKKKYPEICVIFSGEVSDELLGSYIYFLNSPTPEDHRIEVIRLMKELVYFDGLRADRITSSMSCELRLSFYNKDLIDYIMRLPPKYFWPKNNDMIEKKILRDAFTTDIKDEYLPKKLLWRTKHAMSDSTSTGKNSWKDFLKEYTKKQIDVKRFKMRNELYPHFTPQTEEEFFYRETFAKYYPDNVCAKTIPHKWLPKWSGNISDSSATFLNIFTETKFD